MNPIADGTRPQAGLERRQAEDQLQVLRDEQEVADGHEDRQEVDGERRVEGRDPEQAQVDHRVRQRQLAADEQDADDEPDDDGRTGSGAKPSWAICFRPKMTARIATSDMPALSRSSRPAFGSLVLGQHDRSEDQQQAHDRQGEQEDRAPPEVLEQDAAEHRADRAAGRERRDPDADRDAPLPRVLEHAEDERQGRWREGGAGDAQQRPADDQHLGAGRERREERHGPERGRTDEQELAPADAVAERAHRDEEAGDHEPVDVDDPQQLGAARLEVRADRRHRQVQDRQVHHVEQAREREDGQADPFAPAGPGGWGDGRRRGHGGCAPCGGVTR